MSTPGYEIKVQHSKWNDIKLVCACSPDRETKKSFDIIEAYRQVVYKCVRPQCRNMFPVELQLKILADAEKWMDRHDGDISGFDETFLRTLIVPMRKNDLGMDTYKREKCKMRARYLKSVTVGTIKPKTTHIIEVSNITLGVTEPCSESIIPEEK